ncbi:hypothetical protein TUM19329_19090 [Legionella antarctica]|uniref:Transmembrane protein n=1 Tax=Legionella antarctica TaxID=2708020 RepID=A0A6F8T566_9GAMM|nr:hypothetical protein [Legionella antarctica]BCA95548.1 hypothetical protein TUM19329_19090 [Legionella antarctica]
MLYLSLWGAITGTIGTILGVIGLILKAKEFNRNKANLICKSEIKYKSIDDLDVRIFASALGRTPVQMNKLKIYVMPKKFWMRLLKFLYYKRGKFLLELDIPKRKINEQEKVDFKLDIPKGLEYIDIYKLYIIDGVHKEWPVEWPSVSTVKKKIKKIQLGQFEIKGDLQTIILTSYLLYKQFYLKVEHKIPLESYTTGCWFKKKKDLEQAIKKIHLEQEGNLVDGRIDRITFS